MLNRLSYLLLSFLAITNYSFAQQDFFKKAQGFSNIDSTIKYGELSLSFAKKTNDTMLLIDSYLYLSAQYNIQSQYAISLKSCENALNLASFKKNSNITAACYLALADLYNYKNDNVAALNYYLKAKEFFSVGNNKAKQLRCLIDLAEYYRKVAQFETSQQYLNEAFTFYNQNHLHDEKQLIRLLNRQAAVKYEVLDIDSSIYFSNKALALCKKIGNNFLEARSLNELGAAYRNKGNLKTAITYFCEARDIWLSAKEYRYALEAMNNLVILYNNYNYPTAELVKQCNEIIKITKEQKIDFPLMDVYSNLHKIYLKSGDTAKAYIYLANTAQADEEYRFKKLNAEIISIKEKYENEKIKNERDAISSQLSIEKQQIQFGYIIVTTLFVFITIIAFLLYRNIQKNKLLGIQNKNKDVLIQEIHHRVKNNLQFISSLINLQKNTAGGSQNNLLNDASRRINSMSLVHEMLYNQNNIEEVNLKEYLQKLISSINEMVNAKKIVIHFELDVLEITANPSQAIALGMITSELISNAIKYAFVMQKKPTIKVELKKLNNNTFIYSVSDNGIGYDFKAAQNNKLGMRLINIFSRQLKGKYEFINKNGLVYTIQFELT